MHIVVCMKQVPRDNSVKINPDLSINAEGIEQIMNLFDEYAVEEALRWNEKLGGKVTILSLGPEAWKEQIRRALAMGATDALLLSDPAFAALDVPGRGARRRRRDHQAGRCRSGDRRPQLDRR